MGIDISDQVLRMVQLAPARKGYRVRSVSARPVPAEAIQEGEIRQPEVVVNILRDLIRRSALKHPNTRAAVVCLPERKTFTKIIEVPNVEDAQFTVSLRNALAEHIPLNLDEAFVDWQPIGSADPKAKTRRVIVAVAPQLLIESYVSALKAVGIIPIVFEPESAALSRVAIPSSAAKGSHLIIDLGATRTGLIITEGDLVAYSSTLPLSGTGLTSILQAKLSLTTEQAEQAKRLCGLDPRKGKGAVRELLEPELKPLLQRILEIISYYEEHATAVLHVVDVTLVGGGAAMLGLPELMQSTLSLPVHAGTWPANIRVPSTQLQAVATSYLTALGLALRGASAHAWRNGNNDL
ncbi:MAG: type IV pilus assembly protein PilM [Patescibacteria group bacterium]|jgi:type IV pilus assembly protein PilM